MMEKLTKFLLLLLYLVGTTFEGHTTPYTRLVSSMNTSLRKYAAPYIKRPSSTGTKFKGYSMPRIKLDGNFKDLVTQSTVFADKSLLIKDVIENSNTTILIAMPRRWGKSMNLSMIRKFLEIPVDNNGEILDETARKVTDNYQIFRRDCVLQQDSSKSPLAVSQSSILVQDSEDIFVKKEVAALDIQGTYPVIYIDFKNCKGSDFGTVQAGVRRVLRECFTAHSYLMKSDRLDEESKVLVRKYAGAISSKSLDEDEIRSGLFFLSEMLFKHYNKKVWILIDEYDAVANTAYREFSEYECEQTIRLFQGIYEAALKTNEDYLEKGLLTGVQYIAQSGMLSGLNNLGKYDFTDAKYAQYYGLNQSEVDLFFEHFRVPSDLANKAKKWYNGYKVPKYLPQGSTTRQREFIGKYNVWSMVKYLTKGVDGSDFSRFESHWEKSGHIDFLNDLLAKREVRELIAQLVNGQSIPLVRIDDFSANDFKTLKEMIGGNKEINDNGLEVLFSYLFIGGYLTIDEAKTDHYRLPNREITHEMGKRLIRYYKTLYTIDPEKIQEATNKLQQVIDATGENNLSTLLKDFYDQFRGVVRSMRLVRDKNAEGVFMNEKIFHSMLDYITVQTQHTTMGSELYTEKINTGKLGITDLKMTKEDWGMIIEVKCVPTKEGSDQHMQEALEQAKSYENLLKGTEHKLFMAINVAKEDSKPEERSIELWCATGVSEEAPIIKIDTAGNIVTHRNTRRIDMN